MKVLVDSWGRNELCEDRYSYPDDGTLAPIRCSLSKIVEHKIHMGKRHGIVARWRDETPVEEMQRLERERYRREGPYSPMYEGQHPAEATLDALMSTLQTSHPVGLDEIKRAIQRYFDWKAEVQS